MAMTELLALKCLKMERVYPELDVSVSEQLRLYDLLQKDENGITYLEHLCKILNFIINPLNMDVR